MMTTQPSDWAVELLPCPFCGTSCAVLTNTREMERPSSCFMHTVVCDATSDGCGMTVGYEFEPEDAIKRWNTRAPVARELDASGGGAFELVVTGWTKADGTTLWLEQDGVPLFRFGKHDDMGTNRAVHLYATPRAAEAGECDHQWSNHPLSTSCDLCLKCDEIRSRDSLGADPKTSEPPS